VYPEERFLEIVRAAVQTAQATRQSLVLLGVPAKNPETDYGWIQPGTSFTGANGYRLHIASRFIEKPTPEVCRQAMASGALWNTLILACNADFYGHRAAADFPRLYISLKDLLQ
jgi:mannose-1-phosphate guanylyltransferase